MKITKPLPVRTHFDSPLGRMTLAASQLGLCGAWFDGQKHQPDPQAWPLNAAHPVLLQAKAQLAEYFGGRRRVFDLPLDLGAGTDFQQAVWRGLLQIAPGSTTAYGELARRIGKPLAVRALGAAVGRNPISIIVPCHRVVGAGGALTGYAGGLPRKSALLRLEQSESIS
jgi:methylated-DNA-[protein]-cysteine S-methyltransferase